ncbi:MAG: glycosyl hydrolase family 28 protein [Verrucomicrobiota bacterium]
MIATVAFVVTPAAATPILPTIPPGVFNITSSPYNAVSGGVITNTTAIQNAINAAGAAGGGTVEIPAGTFLCGPINLTNKVNLQLDAGATLLFLPENKYPNATGTPAYPISTANCNDVEISGSGTIDGNGAGWWSANPPNRPYMIYFSKCQRVWVRNVTLQNPPKMHLVFKNSASNVTIDGVTINTVDTSPNTDGIDLIGTNCLVQNCYISSGDDNIALGSSSSTATTSDVLITDCTFGSGHGVSIGSNTQGGVSNLVVNNCTFSGTDYGIRMKSDNATSGGSGQGGIARNLTYSNIGMTNILKGAIVIYSYYNEYGTPTAITPFIASTQAVGSVMTPIWRDITISNVTATVASGGIAGILWGRIELPATNITLSHVNITAPAAFDIYNAQGVRLLDSQITVPGGQRTLALYNADVTVSNTAPGAPLITLTGLTSTNTALTLVNCNAATTTNDVFGADPISVSGGTLTVSNALNLAGTSALNFVLGTNKSQIKSTGNLTLSSTLNLAAGTGFSNGTYTVLSYSGKLTGNPVLGSNPGGSYTYTLQTNVAGQVNIVVAALATNHPPTANPATFYRLAGLPLQIPVSSLSTNWYDSDGNPLSLAGVSASTNGVQPAFDSNFIYYTNANSVADQFNYTISDGQGGLGTGLVSVAVVIQQFTGIVVNGDGGMTLQLTGIPGLSYQVEASTNLGDPSAWISISTNVPGVAGSWQVVDSDATNYPQRYYRSRQP